MLRLILRIWLVILLFFVRRLFNVGSRRGTFGPQGDGPGRVPGGDASQDARSRSRRSGAPGPGGVPPLDRTDVVDVPFTEMPPPTDPARGAAGGS